MLVDEKELKEMYTWFESPMANNEAFWAQLHFLNSLADAMESNQTNKIKAQMIKDFQYTALNGSVLDKQTFLKLFPHYMGYVLKVMMYVRKTAYPVLMFGPKCENKRYACVNVETDANNKIKAMTHSYAVLKDLISANTHAFADFKENCKDLESGEYQNAYGVAY